MRKTLYPDSPEIRAYRIEVADVKARAHSVGDSVHQPALYVREYDQNNNLLIDYVIFGVECQDIGSVQDLYILARDSMSTYDKDIQSIRYLD